VVTCFIVSLIVRVTRDVTTRHSTDFIIGRGWEFFSWPPRPDRLWRPPNLLSKGYRRSFPWR